MATIDTLNAKIAKLQAQAEALKKKQSVAVIAQIHQLMDDHGLSIGDLAGGNETGRRKAKRTFRLVPAKRTNRRRSIAIRKPEPNGAVMAARLAGLRAPRIAIAFSSTRMRRALRLPGRQVKLSAIT